MTATTVIKSATIKRRAFVSSILGAFSAIILVAGLTSIGGDEGFVAFSLAMATFGFGIAFRFPVAGNIRASKSGIDIARLIGTRHISRAEISSISIETKTYSGRAGRYQLSTPRLHLRSGNAVWLTSYADSPFKSDSVPHAEECAAQLRAILGVT